MGRLKEWLNRTFVFDDVAVGTGVPGLEWQVKMPKGLTLGEVDVFNHRENIEQAEREGLRPFSLTEILAFDDLKDKIDFLILLDGPVESSAALPANHFRIKNINSETRVASLALTDASGFTENPFVDSFEISADKPFFTGAVLLRFVRDGTVVSPGEACKIICEAVNLAYSQPPLKREVRLYYAEGAPQYPGSEEFKLIPKWGPGRGEAVGL